MRTFLYARVFDTAQTIEHQRTHAGGANAAGWAQCGEWPGLVAIGEGRGDALIDGIRFDTMLSLVIGLDRLEGKSVVALVSDNRMGAIKLT